MESTIPNMTLLPLELFRAVLAEVMLGRGVKRTLRLRLVNRFFSNEVIRMLPELRLLDGCQQRTRSMGEIGADHITHRLLHTNLPVHAEWAQIRRIAARLALEDDEHQEKYPDYVKILCHRAAESRDWHMSVICAEDLLPDANYERSFSYNLLAAAAYTNKCRIIEQLVDQPPNLKIIGGLFSHPHICAAVAEHDAALDLLFAKFETNKSWLLPHVAQQGASIRKVQKFVPAIPKSPNPYMPLWVPEMFKYWTPSVETFDMLVRVHYPKQKVEQSILGNALIEAARQGWEDLLRHLLTLDAPVNNPYWPGPALTRACESGSERIVRLLVEHGAELQDEALVTAAKRGHLNIINALIDLGANPNTGDPLPIVSAINLERKDMFYELLKRGAHLEGENGVEAVNKAKEEGLTSMLAILEEHGVVIQ